MKKKTNIRQVIRTIVREEVAMAIGEVISELKQPTQSQPQPKKIVEKKSFTTNSVLNDVLNETAQNDDWKTMGDGTFKSSKMNEVMSGQYSDLMNDKPDGNQMVASMGVDPNTVDDKMKNILSRDYSELVKTMDKQPKGKITK